MSNDIAKYDEKLAKYAREYAEVEKGGGFWITTRGGVLHVGEDTLPGNQCIAIILDAIHENTYYDTRFDPDVILPPRCYAFGYSEEDMEPVEVMESNDDYFEPQADTCGVCPHNEWGSNDTGRGKACGNRRRLALIAGGYATKKKGSKNDYDLNLFDDPDDLRKADIAFMKLPVTSVRNWRQYVKLLEGTYRRPPFGVYTLITVEQDTHDQFKIDFEVLEEIPSELLDVVLDRHHEAEGVIAQPYSPPDPRFLESAGHKGQQGIKGLRKKK